MAYMVDGDMQTLNRISGIVTADNKKV